MNISFVVKASTKIGYGHLIRSRSLANSIQKFKHKDDLINYYVIGDVKLDNLLSKENFNYSIFNSEEDLIESKDEISFDGIVIFDLLTVKRRLFELTKDSKWVVSLSPIFNFMCSIDAFFHRTKFHEFSFDEKTAVYKDLKFALIQESAKIIDVSSYKRHLAEDKLSIAISMGGGDAANKSLKIVQTLNNLREDYVIWVMLGQGYKHSYDALIEESKKSHHEIILAKTNTSMWKVLSLCSLLILPGGVTTYEAAYAGLPTINIVEDINQRYLIQELLEMNVCAEIRNVDYEELIEKINYYNENRQELFTMHLNTKGIIDGMAADRIYEIISTKRNEL